MSELSFPKGILKIPLTEDASNWNVLKRTEVEKGTLENCEKDTGELRGL